MCDEASVCGNATMRDIVPMHGNAMMIYSVSMYENAPMHDSMPT